MLHSAYIPNRGQYEASAFICRFSENPKFLLPRGPKTANLENVSRDKKLNLLGWAEISAFLKETSAAVPNKEIPVAAGCAK